MNHDFMDDVPLPLLNESIIIVVQVNLIHLLIKIQIFKFVKVYLLQFLD